MSTVINQTPQVPANDLTPSHEWASDTVGAVHNAAEATQGNAPKDEGRIPGAFPGSISSKDEREFANTAQNVYSHIEKDYIAPAQQNFTQTTQNMYASAEQAARQYLPQGVVNKLEQVGVLGAASGEGNAQSNSHPSHHISHPTDTRPADATSLPSHETGTFHPTYGGVGTLPGQPTESGVAKLPDERLQDLRDELPTHEGGIFKPTHGGVGSLPGEKDEEGVVKLPDERTAEQRDRNMTSEGLREQMPTADRASEGDTFKATYGGVGSLPGSRHEEGVAKLPDERAQDIRDEMPTREADAFHPTHGGVGSLPGPKNESNVAKLPDEREGERVRGASTKDLNPFSSTMAGTQEPASINAASKNPFTNASEVTERGDNSYRNIQDFSSQENPKPNSNIVTGTKEPVISSPSQPKPYTPSAATQHAPPAPKTDASPETSSATTGTTKTQEKSKVGLGTKIKAEAKIFAGKMRKNEGKVEEGKAMKQNDV